MVRRTPLSRRRPRLAAAATVALSFVATCAATSTVYGAPRDPAITTPRLGAPAAKASGGSVNLASSSLKVVSSTGHKLRVRVFAFRSSTGTSIEVGVETRDLREQHAWTFKAPDSAVSLSAKGKGRIRLTSTRSGGFATISLRSSPVGRAVLSTCHKKTATKIRHVALSGTLRFKTRSDGKHAWGSVGSAHHTVHFSTKSKLTWFKPAASNCPTAEFPCRNTFLWQAESLPADELDLVASDNKGAHAEITGGRFVTLTQPSGATRSDIVTLPQPSPNQLIVNSDGSATMQAIFRGGTVTMSSPAAITQTLPCGKGKKKISAESWQADVVNGATPIRVPAQVFGGFSTADTPQALFGRIRVKH